MKTGAKKKQICRHKLRVINIDEVIYTARMVACKQMERYDANCWICYDVAIGRGGCESSGNTGFLPESKINTLA